MVISPVESEETPVQGFHFPMKAKGLDHILLEWSSSVHEQWTNAVVKLDLCFEV